MAAKNFSGDKKRKAAPGGKGKFDGKAKKPRVEATMPRPAPQPEPEDTFESFSDSDDGGVALDDGVPNKTPKGADNDSNGKTFERGMPWSMYTTLSSR